METKVATNRSYEDFDPVSKWRREEARDTVELYLPGFKREQIRIQVNHLGFMVISGERALDGTRWKRFKKEIELPMYCNVDSIHGNFMQNILTVVMPKKIPTLEQEIREQISPKLEPEIKKDKGKKKVTYDDETTEFGQVNSAIEEEMDEIKCKEALLRDDNEIRGYHKVVENDDELITPETTREVALKFMLVIIVILVIVSYIADMSRSLMAHAQSYFHN